MPAPDQLPPGPLRDFVQALHDLYDRAGQPPARAVSNVIRLELPARRFEAVSHETVSATLRGRPAPSWGKVRSIVAALGLMSESDHDDRELLLRFNPLWSAARAAAPVASEEPTDPASIALPPLPPPVAPERSPLAIRVDELRPFAVDPLPAGDQEAVGPLPPVTDFYVDRGDLLDRMRDSLLALPRNPLVLYGPVGTGKTQLALHYVARHSRDYSIVWWVPAETVEGARESLAVLAGRLGVPAGSSISETVDDVRGRLAGQAGDYLLVFDGVEDEQIRELLPTAGGHVIITSRDPSWGRANSSSGMEVTGYTGAEARRFLLVRAGGLAEAQAERLIDRVGRLPLALDQAVAAHEVAEVGWDEWLIRLDEKGAEVLEAGRPAHYPRPLGESVRSCLDRLRAMHPPAALAVELFATLAPGSVPLSLLSNGLAGEAPGALSAVLRNAVQRRQIVALMTRHGLVRLDDETERLEVEPIIGLTLRRILSRDALARARQHVHAILAAADPGWPDDIASGEMHREIAVHVGAACLVESRLLQAQQAMYHQIRFHYMIGDYARANELAESAVRRWREDTFLGPDNPLVLQAARQWANAMRALGEYDRARELTADGLSRLRANPDYGDDHAHTLEMHSSHAADLRIAGEYRHALEVATEIYLRYRDRFGERDGRTTRSRHNLAVSWRLLGAFADAEQADRTTLDRHRELRGDTDWRTLLSVNALGEDLYGLGRYADALTVLSEGAAGAERRPEPFDRGLVLSERTAALARRGLGEVHLARAQLEAHYEFCRRQFGAEHEYTLSARMSLANTLRQLGEQEQAHRHAEEAAAVYRRMLGPRNPLTLAAQVNLAAILRTAGDYGEARRLDAVASEALRDTLGDRHPFTAAAMIGLASDYACISRYASAVVISRRAQAVAQAERGPEHPDTLVAAANLSLDLAATGSGGEAANLRAEVRETVARTLGAEHPLLADIDEQVRLECPVEAPST